MVKLLIEKAVLNEKVVLDKVDDYWAEVVFKYTGELGYTYFARAQNQKERAYWRNIKFYPSLEVAKRKFIARLKPRKVL